MKSNSKNLNLMNQIASNIVLDKAMKDKKEQMNKKNQNQQMNEQDEKEYDFDSDVSMDSDEEEIIRQMKEKMTQPVQESIQQKELKGYFQEKSESEFFELIKQKKEKIVAHFYHNDFQKCQILNFNLEKVAYEHPESLFIKINAESSNFLVNKLQIRTLPVIIFFLNGEVKGKIVGFEEIGNQEEVNHIALTRKLGQMGALDLKESEKFKLKTKNKVRGESSDEEY